MFPKVWLWQQGLVLQYKFAMSSEQEDRGSQAEKTGYMSIWF